MRRATAAGGSFSGFGAWRRALLGALVAGAAWGAVQGAEVGSAPGGFAPVAWSAEGPAGGDGLAAAAPDGATNPADRVARPDAVAPVIDEVEELCKRHSVPMIGRVKAERLAELVRRKKPELVVECGTALGYSGLWIARELQRAGRGRLITIEIDPRRAREAEEFFRKAGLEKIVTVETGDARQLVRRVEGRVDFAFLDCNYENYLPCFEGLLPRLAPGAIVVADNAGIGASGMKEYLELVRSKHQSKTEWFDVDLPWVRRDAMEVTTIRKPAADEESNATPGKPNSGQAESDSGAPESGQSGAGTSAKDFWACLAGGDTAGMGRFYADKVLVLRGSELLKPEWRLPGGGQRDKDLLVGRDDLVAGYARLIGGIGRAKWREVFGRIAPEAIRVEPLDMKQPPPGIGRDAVGLTVRPGADDHRLLFILDRDTEGRWHVVAEATDY